MFDRFAFCLLLLCSAGCSSGGADSPIGGPTAIQLNIINTSEDPSVTVAVFQENLALPSTSIAWKVFSFASNDNQLLTIAQSFEMLVEVDRYQSPLYSVEPGYVYQVIQEDHDVIEVSRSGSSSEPTAIEVRNDLVSETIDLVFFRDKELVAKIEGLSPHYVGVFEFPDSLHFVVGDYEPGDPIDTTSTTEIALAGVRSADIVIGGSAATSYTFAITNVVYE